MVSRDPPDRLYNVDVTPELEIRKIFLSAAMAKCKVFNTLKLYKKCAGDTMPL